MPLSVGALIYAAHDFARCLTDERKLKFPIPIKDGILPIVGLHVAAGGPEYKITLHRRNWSGHDLKSRLLRYKDHARIRYAANLNPCWRRFVICKELAHLAFDKEDQFTSDYATLAQDLVIGTSMASAHQPSLSEKLCIFGAIELLLPWELRPELEKMRDEGRTDLEIATHCKVPQQHINTLLRSDYGQMSDKIHRAAEAGMSDWSASKLELGDSDAMPYLPGTLPPVPPTLGSSPHTSGDKKTEA